MKAKDTLAQSFTLKNGTVVKNRLFKSAMSEALGNRKGVPTSSLNKLYSTWANGGIGICVTGNVMIDKRYISEPGNVVIEDESNLDALKAWAKAATQHNTQCWVQINHPGKQSPRGLNKENIAPSAIPFRKEMQPFFATPREMTEYEIEEMIARFGQTAGIIRKAGFTGVQIHGCHGYLVSQFLSPHHNARSDKWGGNEENRRRFVLEVYRSIREAVGDDFNVSIKLNSADFQRGGFTEEESLNTVKALADAGIDLIEISGGTYEAPAMTGIKWKQSTIEREAYFLQFAEKARKIVDIPLVVTGGFRTAEGMANAIKSEAVDFVGLARILAIEPDLPNRLLDGKQSRHTVRPIKTGIPMIDKMGIMEVSWYTGQLKRMGQGLEANPNENPLKSFFKIVGKQVLAGRIPRRLRAS